jgi:hypothetical protein
MATVAGTMSLFLFYRRSRWFLVGLTVVVACLVFASLILQLGWLTSWEFHLEERVGSTIRFGEASSWFEELVFRVEVFDAVALLFLAANPVYILFGTGPGLISIPATPFLPVSSYYEIFRAAGINSPPSMGGLLELSNGGLIGVFLWTAFFVTSLRAINYVIRHSRYEREQWEIGRGAFVGAAAMYLVAAGFLSSFWVLFMSLGLAAAYLQYVDRKHQSEARQS